MLLAAAAGGEGACGWHWELRLRRLLARLFFDDRLHEDAGHARIFGGQLEQGGPHPRRLVGRAVVGARERLARAGVKTTTVACQAPGSTSGLSRRRVARARTGGQMRREGAWLGLAIWIIASVVGPLVMSCQAVIDTDQYVFPVGAAGQAGASGSEVGGNAAVPEGPAPDAGEQPGEDASEPLSASGDPLPQCPGCKIDGVCIGPGEPHPGNACQECDPARARDAWSDREGPCDDGLFCTVDDACQVGMCIGFQRVCEDGVACNGSSSCDEAGRRCTPDENQCQRGELCDTASGTCVSTCTGCSVEGVCVPPSAEKAGNPCLVCQPEMSSTDYTPAQGKACGNAASECSEQDTCDDSGGCEPRHLPAGSGCGDASTTDCNQADSCDGDGQCLPRFIENGASCADAFFCTGGDSCQGGSCVARSEAVCPTAQTCNETANRCECLDGGCFIDGVCVAIGALDPGNACRVCDPARSSSSYSPNTGARCGAGATVCSAQDTCSSSGICQPNHLRAGTVCRAAVGCLPGSACDGSGACVAGAPPDGASCDDGVFCTQGDRCQGGFCVGGTRSPLCQDP